MILIRLHVQNSRDAVITNILILLQLQYNAHCFLVWLMECHAVMTTKLGKNNIVRKFQTKMIVKQLTFMIKSRFANGSIRSALESRFLNA